MSIKVKQEQMAAKVSEGDLGSYHRQMGDTIIQHQHDPTLPCHLPGTCGPQDPEIPVSPLVGNL